MAKYCLNRGCGQKFEEENNGTGKRRIKLIYFLYNIFKIF